MRSSSAQFVWSGPQEDFVGKHQQPHKRTSVLGNEFVAGRGTAPNPADAQKAARSTGLVVSTGEIAGSRESGVTFLAPGETAAREVTLDDGRRIGLSESAVQAEEEYRRRVAAHKANPTPETLQAGLEAKERYYTEIAGSRRAYHLAQVHLRSEAMSVLRERTKEERELAALMERARELDAEKGTGRVKATPAHEEYLRVLMRQQISTREGAAKFIAGSSATPEDIQALLDMKKPGFLQRAITRRETKRVKRLIAELEALPNPE